MKAIYSRPCKGREHLKEFAIVTVRRLPGGKVRVRAVAHHPDKPTPTVRRVADKDTSAEAYELADWADAALIGGGFTRAK